MPIEDFIEKEFISARFILAMLVIIGYIVGQVDPTVAGIIIAFYFGSKVVNSQVDKY